MLNPLTAACDIIQYAEPELNRQPAYNSPPPLCPQVHAWSSGLLGALSPGMLTTPKPMALLVACLETHAAAQGCVTGALPIFGGVIFLSLFSSAFFLQQFCHQMVASATLAQSVCLGLSDGFQPHMILICGTHSMPVACSHHACPSHRASLSQDYYMFSVLNLSSQTAVPKNVFLCAPHAGALGGSQGDPGGGGSGRVGEKPEDNQGGAQGGGDPTGRAQDASLLAIVQPALVHSCGQAVATCDADVVQPTLTLCTAVLLFLPEVCWGAGTKV